MKILFSRRAKCFKVIKSVSNFFLDCLWRDNQGYHDRVQTGLLVAKRLGLVIFSCLCKTHEIVYDPVILTTRKVLGL